MTKHEITKSKGGEILYTMKNVRCLQGQCYEIFDPYLRCSTYRSLLNRLKRFAKFFDPYLRCSTWVTFEQAKTVSRNFSFPEDIRLADTQFLHSIQIKHFVALIISFYFSKVK